MNDGNIRYYLKQEMADLKAQIKFLKDNIEGYNRQIDDTLKTIQSLKIHYTSLLNTAIAYGYEVEEDEQDDQD